MEKANTLMIKKKKIFAQTREKFENLPEKLRENYFEHFVGILLLICK